MPKSVADLLSNRRFAIAARLFLTFAFWSSGFMELLDFPANAAAMQAHGLTPGWAFNAATIAVQMTASLMIICDRGTWLAAGALGVFTALTIPIAHPFWRERGAEAFHDMTTAMEHVSLLGGLALVAIASRGRESQGREMALAGSQSD